MIWIQYTLRISLLSCIVLLSSMVSDVSSAQQERIILSLKPDNSQRLRQNQFYIEEVEDQRKQPGSGLGRIISAGKTATLALPATAERALFDYWTAQAPRKNDSYLPLYITVTDLVINEKLVAPGKVNAEGKLAVKFRWYRNMEAVDLTSFQTSVTYTRTNTEYDHAKLIAQMMDQALTHFHKWMNSNVGKHPALARNLILTFKEIAGSNDEDTVFYCPKRPLIWQDFRGKGRPGTRYAAAVFSSFAYEGSSFPKGNDLVVEIGLKIFMIKSMSWGNSDARNANTIRHEQIHFDITRIVAERFKERLKKASLTIEDFDSEIQYQFLESFRDMNREQELYDAETGHGIKVGEQNRWDDKVSKEIKRIYSTN